MSTSNKKSLNNYKQRSSSEHSLTTCTDNTQFAKYNVHIFHMQQFPVYTFAHIHVSCLLLANEHFLRATGSQVSSSLLGKHFSFTFLADIFPSMSRLKQVTFSHKRLTLRLCAGIRSVFWL